MMSCKRRDNLGQPKSGVQGFSISSFQVTMMWGQRQRQLRRHIPRSRIYSTQNHIVGTLPESEEPINIINEVNIAITVILLYWVLKKPFEPC